MFGGVPNLAYALGYTNASWTLKCDLVARVRLPAAEPHGRARLRQCTPREPDPALETQPFIDLTSGYVLRSIDAMPRSRACRAPWRLYQNYARDVRLLRRGALEDGAMEFSAPARAPMPTMVSVP